ncbi:unnamed protein product [Mesocestoides corti]|uniref:Uncharacterized protein n=1 Tax=Mesocestoides corti TaxID=53468 RepID=A0A0R3U6S2_MESCO|nr:unnamed protein product [Mesocestoides corti]
MRPTKLVTKMVATGELWMWRKELFGGGQNIAPRKHLRAHKISEGTNRCLLMAWEHEDEAAASSGDSKVSAAKI